MTQPTANDVLSRRLTIVFTAKTARVFVSGLVSIITPVYLAALGYSALYVGLSILAIVASNVASNILLTRYEARFGRRNFLYLFSALMLAGGLLLFTTTYLPLIFFAFLIGNISTTGTEAGPFQSIEAGILPRLVAPNRLARSFGVYNLLGYGAASFGALAASVPAYYQDGLPIFRLLFLVFGLVGMFLLLLYAGLGDIEASKADGQGSQGLSKTARSDVNKLSSLFFLDAFGGSFVTQSLLSYWFFISYHVSLAGLGDIFFVVNLITAASIFGATIIAEKLGNLRTMVATHLVSNVFLIAIPFAGSLAAALALLVMRQSVSQMDVPTRQAFMAEVFDERSLVAANATTNTFRNIGGLFGGPISGVLYSMGALAYPIAVGGASKIAYDLSIFASYRHRVPSRSGEAHPATST